jgi:hypothetical protein
LKTVSDQIQTERTISACLNSHGAPETAGGPTRTLEITSKKGKESLLGTLAGITLTTKVCGNVRLVARERPRTAGDDTVSDYAVVPGDTVLYYEVGGSNEVLESVVLHVPSLPPGQIALVTRGQQLFTSSFSHKVPLDVPRFLKRLQEVDVHDVLARLHKFGQVDAQTGQDMVAGTSLGPEVSGAEFKGIEKLFGESWSDFEKIANLLTEHPKLLNVGPKVQMYVGVRDKRSTVVGVPIVHLETAKDDVSKAITNYYADVFPPLPEKAVLLEFRTVRIADVDDMLEDLAVHATSLLALQVRSLNEAMNLLYDNDLNLCGRAVILKDAASDESPAPRWWMVATNVVVDSLNHRGDDHGARPWGAIPTSWCTAAPEPLPRYVIVVTLQPPSNLVGTLFRSNAIEIPGKSEGNTLWAYVWSPTKKSEVPMDALGVYLRCRDRASTSSSALLAGDEYHRILFSRRPDSVRAVAYTYLRDRELFIDQVIASSSESLAPVQHRMRPRLYIIDWETSWQDALDFLARTDFSVLRTPLTRHRAILVLPTHALDKAASVVVEVRAALEDRSKALLIDVWLFLPQTDSDAPTRGSSTQAWGGSDASVASNATSPDDLIRHLTRVTVPDHYDENAALRSWLKDGGAPPLELLERSAVPRLSTWDRLYRLVQERLRLALSFESKGLAMIQVVRVAKRYASCGLSTLFKGVAYKLVCADEGATTCVVWIEKGRMDGSRSAAALLAMAKRQKAIQLVVFADEEVLNVHKLLEKQQPVPLPFVVVTTAAHSDRKVDLLIEPFLTTDDVVTATDALARHIPESSDALASLHLAAVDPNRQYLEDRHLFVLGLTALRGQYQPAMTMVRRVVENLPKSSDARRSLTTLAFLGAFADRQYRCLPQRAARNLPCIEDMADLLFEHDDDGSVSIVHPFIARLILIESWNLPWPRADTAQVHDEREWKIVSADQHVYDTVQRTLVATIEQLRVLSDLSGNKVEEYVRHLLIERRKQAGGAKERFSRLVQYGLDNIAHASTASMLVPGLLERAKGAGGFRDDVVGPHGDIVQSRVLGWLARLARTRHQNEQAKQFAQAGEVSAERAYAALQETEYRHLALHNYAVALCRAKQHGVSTTAAPLAMFEQLCASCNAKRDGYFLRMALRTAERLLSDDEYTTLAQSFNVANAVHVGPGDDGAGAQKDVDDDDDEDVRSPAPTQQWYPLFE